jgi:hypothetical protein
MVNCRVGLELSQYTNSCFDMLGYLYLFPVGVLDGAEWLPTPAPASPGAADNRVISLIMRIESDIIRYLRF